MPSNEVFAENVRNLLIQRNIRIKDLAEAVGLSESYLSLVLSGARKNLGDKYKDLIAAYLNVSVAQLYSTDRSLSEARSTVPLPEDPDRKETRDLIDQFLLSTNLEAYRNAFAWALGMMNDQEARSVKRFFSRVLEEMHRRSLREGPGSSAILASLRPEEKHVLLLCSLAGPNARIEWVRAASDMGEDEFDQVMRSLCDRGLVELLEDGATRRATAKEDMSAVAPSVATQARLRRFHMGLAAAMEEWPDPGPFHELRIAEQHLRAQAYNLASDHFLKAAKLLEEARLWEEAARAWHELAVVRGIVGAHGEKAKHLCEAARCMAEAGNFDAADELGSYACAILETESDRDELSRACIAIGNSFMNKVSARSIPWYRKGLAVTPRTSRRYGRLLVNLASSLFAEGRVAEAEATVRDCLEWAREREPQDVADVTSHAALTLGLIEFHRRNWKASKENFLAFLDQASETNPGDVAVAWHNLGMIMYREDKCQEAASYLRKAQDVYLSLGAKTHWAYAAVELAKVCLRQGKYEEAIILADKAQSWLGNEATRELAWIKVIEACVLAAEGRLREAGDKVRAAVDAFQMTRAERDLACASLWLARLESSMGNAKAALAAERRAFQVYEKRHWDLRELHRECSLLYPRTEKEAMP